MKRFTILTFTITLALLLSAALPAAAASSRSFRGNWKGIDVDGSKLTLSFTGESRSGGLIFDIQGYDAMCSLCGGSPAKMTGIGAVQGVNAMNASTIWWSVPTATHVFYFPNQSFTYHPLTDTITDSTDPSVVYHRVH